MSRRAGYLPRQERDSSTFDNSFQTLGVALAAPGLLVKIINNSTVDIDVSIDEGVTEHDFVPAESFVLYDLRANHGKDKEYGFPASTQFSIRGAAAGAGNVYLIVIREVT